MFSDFTKQRMLLFSYEYGGCLSLIVFIFVYLKNPLQYISK